MTLGNKIKEARKNAGLTQEQLSVSLSVSRQAITKWESDKGMPDIENLKLLSKALNVSIDYLLDDENSLTMNTIREPLDLTKYKQDFSFHGTPGKMGQKNRLLMEKYPDAEIYVLQAEQILTKAERVIDNILMFTTSLAGGLINVVNSANNLDHAFYLVNDKEQQYLVLITKDFLETTRLAQRITSKKFTVGNYHFKIGIRLS